MAVHEVISPHALERFQRPRNYGPLAQFNGHARITGPCGDTMEIWLQVADGRIAQAGFTTTGCGPSRAAGSMATECAMGKPLEDALRIERREILEALGGLPTESEHCALLAANTLKTAIGDYSSKVKPGGSPQCKDCSKDACSSKQQRPDESEQEFAERQALTQRMCQIGYKLVVLSGKGGVGKSTVSANLAAALSLAGKAVGLLDVDVHGPSIPKLMGLDGSRLSMHESEIVPLEIGTLKVMSIGFLLQSDRAPVIWRGPMKYNVIRQFLKDVGWGPLDYLVVDSPPGTGDEPLSVAQLIGLPAGAIIVTTPQDLAIADVRRSVSFCEKVSLPVIGIIENMSGMVCPHCGGRVDLFKSGGGELLAKEMGVPFLGRVPIDPQIVECGDSGVPYIHRFAESEAAKAFGGIVDRILDAVKLLKSSVGTC